VVIYYPEGTGYVYPVGVMVIYYPDGTV